MKVVILAGGFGTRLSEETSIRPKPMVEVGGRPILWHIMKLYSHHGFKEFVILGGYKVDFIRNYFLNFRGKQTDYTIDLKTGRIEWLQGVREDWTVTVLDTGPDSLTGGRIKRAQPLQQRACLGQRTGGRRCQKSQVRARPRAPDRQFQRQPCQVGGLNLGRGEGR